MTAGIYRSTYSATYRAALDADNILTAIHVRAGGIPESPLYADRFPAGAVDNYLAEDWTIASNITIGSFRAPSPTSPFWEPTVAEGGLNQVLPAHFSPFSAPFQPYFSAIW